ncbi:MAG TPA: hypothetical protein VFN26_06320 [Candidatus Acidoferrum sp.]|nr:hypothetical protein [Candidatus Acidoferrum sp.]
MKRVALVSLCLAGAFATAARGQASKIDQVQVASGTVLTFYLHARLNRTSGDVLDALPKGTLLRVKMLDSIDSSVNPDGTEFHGSVVSALASEGNVVIHRESEVRGILALLRSRSHPEGFRYELLITGLNDHGKSYALTASLNPSFTDSSAASSSSRPAAKDSPKPAASGISH